MFSYDPLGFGDPWSSTCGNRRRQEHARRQRMMEEERRRKAEYEQRRRIDEQMSRKQQQRRSAMLDRECRRKEDMMRQRLAEKRTAKKKPLSYPPGTVVLGPDGNLYRVVSPTPGPTPREGTRVHAPNKNLDTFAESKSINDENLSKNQYDAIKDNSMGTDTDSYEEWHDCQDMDVDQQIKSHTHKGHVYEDVPSSSKQKHGTLNKIIVEDVSDDEDEELRDLHSVFRNKVPSNGQWMEPVE